MAAASGDNAVPERTNHRRPRRGRTGNYSTTFIRHVPASAPATGLNLGLSCCSGFSLLFTEKRDRLLYASTVEKIQANLSAWVANP
jgi:hypothetical protein